MDYDQIVERLIRDGYIVKEKPKAEGTNFYFSRAANHFELEYKKASKNAPRGGWGIAWDHIRKAVQWKYGASTAKQMPMDKIEEANDLAIRLIDELIKN